MTQFLFAALFSVALWTPVSAERGVGQSAKLAVERGVGQSGSCNSADKCAGCTTVELPDVLGETSESLSDDQACTYSNDWGKCITTTSPFGWCSNGNGAETKAKLAAERGVGQSGGCNSADKCAGCKTYSDGVWGEKWNWIPDNNSIKCTYNDSWGCIIRGQASVQICSNKDDDQPATQVKKLFEVSELRYGCDVDSNCVSSKNFPQRHGNSEYCTVTALQAADIVADTTFELEEGYDILKIGDVDIRSVNQIPDRIDEGTAIYWDADSSVSKKGWKICFSSPTTVSAERGVGQSVCNKDDGCAGCITYSPNWGESWNWLSDNPTIKCTYKDEYWKSCVTSTDLMCSSGASGEMPPTAAPVVDPYGGLYSVEVSPFGGDSAEVATGGCGEDTITNPPCADVFVGSYGGCDGLYGKYCAKTCCTQTNDLPTDCSSFNLCTDCVAISDDYDGATKRTCDWVENSCQAISDPANASWRDLTVDAGYNCPDPTTAPCVDDDAGIIKLAAENGFTISGCSDASSKCAMAQVQDLCKVTCGQCGKENCSPACPIGQFCWAELNECYYEADLKQETSLGTAASKEMTLTNSYNVEALSGTLFMYPLAGIGFLASIYLIWTFTCGSKNRLYSEIDSTEV